MNAPQAWQIAQQRGYVCLTVSFSAQAAERIASDLIARAEWFRARAQRNGCAAKVEAGPVQLALHLESLAYALW